MFKHLQREKPCLHEEWEEHTWLGSFYNTVVISGKWGTIRSSELHPNTSFRSTPAIASYLFSCDFCLLYTGSQALLNFFPNSLLIAPSVVAISRDSHVTLAYQLGFLHNTAVLPNGIWCPWSQQWCTSTDCSVCPNLTCLWCSFSLMLTV